MHKIPNKFKFKELSNEKDWLNILPKGRIKEYKEEDTKGLVNVVVISPYKDLQLQEDLTINNIIKVTEERANYLVQRKLVKIL